MQETVHAKAIKRAAERLGGLQPLARKLGISHTRLQLYADGVQPTPTQLFLKVVDLLLEEDFNHLGLEKPARSDRRA